MNNNLTELVFILDESSSMNHLKQSTVDGFNKLIKEQRDGVGEANVTVVFFNSEVKTIVSAIDLNKLREDLIAAYSPNGYTALLDAIGTTIESVGKRLSETNEEDRPGKVLVVVVTDGEENSSRTYTKAKVHDMVKTQTDTYSWEFIFLGANIDAFAVGGQLGFSSVNTSSYDASVIGTQSMYSGVSASAKSYRSGGSAAISIDDNDKK